MGTVESHKQCGQNQYSRFKYIDTVEIYQFGKVQRYYDEITRHEAVKTIHDFILETDKEAEFISKLKTYNNNCPYLISMLKINKEINSICANCTSFHMYFQFLPITLTSIIHNSQTPFPEHQVCLLLGSLLEAIKFINQNESYHGDIYPDFIYLEQRGQRRYKIFDSAYFNPSKHGYYRAFDQDSFSSPEILAYVLQKRPFPQYNINVSDIFPIGLICLYCMTLINPLTAYKTKNKEIDSYYIQMILRIAKRNGYSHSLLSCIEQCIQFRKRPTAKDLLKTYQFLNSNNINQKISLRR